MTSMTLDPPLTNPLPPGSELVAGVDTHKNTHHVAILDLVGRPVADREFRADGRGYAQIVAFLHGGDVVRIGVEGTGSYGAGLSRATRGADRIEVARQDRQARRRREVDPLDAQAASLSSQELTLRSRWRGQSRWILQAARPAGQSVITRSALLITAPERRQVPASARLVNTPRLGGTIASDPGRTGRQCDGSRSDTSRCS